MADIPYAAPTALGPQHKTEGFDCGKPPLNEFLTKFALTNQSGGSARTFVVCVSNRVIAYYSLTAAAIAPESAPDRVRKGQPRHPIPAILMARFAVDLRYQGHGLGQALLRDALLRSLRITDELGARVFVVDAKDEEAARFYGRFGMQAAPDEPRRLFLLFKDVRQLLAA